MYRKYYLVEVVILLFLSHGGWNGPSVTLLSCTSESSKLIRNVVQKQLLPVVSRYGVSLPTECPLHPRRDMFWWLQTDVQGIDNYQCPICGEKFHCENKFVSHWDISHARNLGLPDEIVCLDDYCDVFRCDVLRQKEQLANLQNNKVTDDTVIKTNLADNQQDGILEKSECQPGSMFLLRNKCRSVVRQCTMGLIANLSLKDFQDLEEELDEALCSYLTCDKYWNDFNPQLHYVPTIVCIMAALTIFTGFCLCYYGTWLLMDNSASDPRLCCTCRKPRPLSRQKKAKLHHYNQPIQPASRQNGHAHPIPDGF